MLRRRQSLCWRCRTSERTEADSAEAWPGLNRERPASSRFPALRGAFSACSCIKSPLSRLKNRLATIIGDGRDIRNNATLATAILALRCGEMIHPFVVLR